MGIFVELNRIESHYISLDCIASPLSASMSKLEIRCCDRMLFYKVFSSSLSYFVSRASSRSIQSSLFSPSMPLLVRDEHAVAGRTLRLFRHLKASFPNGPLDVEGEVVLDERLGGAKGSERRDVAHELAQERRARVHLHDGQRAART